MTDPWSLDPAALAQPWRLFTGHLAHWSLGHLLSNVLAGLVPWLLMDGAERRRSRLGLALLAPLLSLALLPALGEAPYRGASGLVCALWAWAGLVRWADWEGKALLGLLGLKVLAELLAWGSPMGAIAQWRSLAWAHLFGALLGGLGWRLIPPGRPGPPQR